MVWRIASAGLAVALLLMVGGADLNAQDDTFEWSDQLASGKVLEVKGISGHIRAVAASGNTAEVIAEKRGRRRDFDEVRIEMVEEDDGITICAVYGSWNRGDDPCDYSQDDDDDRRHWNDRRDIRVSVDFEVRVPAGVEFIGSTISGNVEARDLESEATCTTVSGDVFISTTEVAWGNTVSGEIEIEMHSLDWNDLHLNTVSGDITLWLPDGLDADVEFDSLSGDFDTEFDITLRSRRSRFIGSRIRGTIGDGGRDLSFNTVSGDVELRRLRR